MYGTKCHFCVLDEKEAKKSDSEDEDEKVIHKRNRKSNSPSSSPVKSLSAPDEKNGGQSDDEEIRKTSKS